MIWNAFLRELGRVAKAIETGLAVVAALSMLAILFLTTADVVMRYAINAPLGWAYDLVTYYLLAATFFLAFPLALGAGDHIAVDFIARKLPQRLTRLALAPACLLSAALFGAVGWYGLHEAIAAWRQDEVIAGAILWPVWQTKIFLPLSMWAMALRLVHIGLSHAGAAVDAARFPFRAPAFHAAED
ncbi:MAG: TRAP transporter small permease [Pseudodonghicola sp.]